LKHWIQHKKYKSKERNVKKEFQGSYHFGAVRFTFSGQEIRNGVYCNCSICMRKGALMNAELISPANLKNRIQK